MTEHSLLGASSASRWLNCPGSFKLSQTAPHRPSSIYAATGTLAHEYIQGAVLGGETQVDLPKGPVIFAREGHSIEVDQDFIDGVNVMLEYLKHQAAGHDWFKVEFRVDLDSYFTSPPVVPVFGTVDAGILQLWNNELEVIDYKNGSGIAVSPIENAQLLFYAAGVLAQIQPDWRRRVRKIKLTIVQPNAGGAPIRSWEIDVLDLLLWVDGVLVPGVGACAQDNAPLNPGPWCRFCPVSHACPRLMQDAVAMAKHEFNDDPPQETDELGKALDAAERAELWIERIREFAVNQLEHQVRIPGWGLVPTRPTRKWTLPDDDIANELCTTLDGGDVFETRLRSPAQMEKRLTRTSVGRKVWDQVVAPLVEARSSGVKLGRDHHTTAAEEAWDETT